MIFVLLIIGVIIVVAAVRNSQGALFTALGQDVPAFVVWAAAIFALGAIGFVPGLKPVSRGLLALVLVVLILRNYKQIISGFQTAWQHPPAPVASKSTDPATGTQTQNNDAGASSSVLDIFGGNTSAAPVTGAF